MRRLTNPPTLTYIPISHFIRKIYLCQTGSKIVGIIISSKKAVTRLLTGLAPRKFETELKALFFFIDKHNLSLQQFARIIA